MLDPALWPIKGDPSQIAQVVMNVSINAAESICGIGRVSISTRNLLVEQSLAWVQTGLVSGPYACLTIEDDGEGMDAATRAKVFEPFFTTKSQGRGLGLSAAYGIVKNHGGQIEVSSTKGKGTRFRIYLPAVEKAAEPPPAAFDDPGRRSAAAVCEPRRNRARCGR